jgi:hypothetical protein
MPPSNFDPFGYRQLAASIAAQSAKMDGIKAAVDKPGWLTPPAATTAADAAAAPVYYPPIIDVGGQTYMKLDQIIAGQALQATLVQQNAGLVVLAEIAGQLQTAINDITALGTDSTDAVAALQQALDGIAAAAAALTSAVSTHQAPPAT